MYCKSCGAELPDVAVFCEYCGAKVKEETGPEGVYQEVPPEYSEYREAPRDAAYPGDARTIAPNPADVSYSGGRPNENFTLYLILAIVSTLLCGCTCFGLIPGILSIVFAAQINSNNKAGNYEEADKAAKRALVCIIITVALGIIGVIFGLIANSAGLLAGVAEGFEGYEGYEYYY